MSKKQSFFAYVEIAHIPSALSLVTAGVLFFSVVVTGADPGAVFNSIRPTPSRSSADMQVLSAAPNPVVVCDGSGQGSTTLSWTVEAGGRYEIRRGASTGDLVAAPNQSGSQLVQNVAANTIFYIKKAIITSSHEWRWSRTRGWYREEVLQTSWNVIGQTTILHTQDGCASSKLTVAVNPGAVVQGGSYTLTATYKDASNQTVPYEGLLDYSLRVCQLTSPSSCTNSTGQWGNNTLVNGSVLVNLPTTISPAYYNARFRPRGGAGEWSNETTVQVNPLPPANRLPVGNVDVANCTAVSGWAADPDTNASINVQIFEGGSMLATVQANVPRPDVVAAGYLGDHGFIWPVPDSLKNGQSRTLRVYALDSAGGGQRTDLGSRSIFCGGSSSANTIDINTIRSVTYWDSLNDPQRDRGKWLGCSDTYTSELEAQIQRIKDTGFNTVWLISWWRCFLEMGPSPNMVYKDQGFVRLRDTLDMLKRHNVKAVLSLTYIEALPTPQGGVWNCDILNYKDANGNPVGYWSIRDYYTKYLSEIQNYNNDVIIQLHSEGLMCQSFWRTYTPDQAALSRNTIGRLPLDLPPTLRSKFLIGFHDAIDRVITENGNGVVTDATAPMPRPAPYDFYSTGFYEPFQTQMGGYGVTNLLDERFQKIRDYYGQGYKIFFGELGSDLCYYSYYPQAAADNLKSMLQSVISRGHGVNVWEWIGHSCSVVDSSYKLNDNQGNPYPTLQAVKSILRP